METLMELVADVPAVYLVTIKVPFDYETGANERIAAAAASHENVFLIDWHAISHDKPEWFRADLLHPNDDGRVQFSNLLIDSIGPRVVAP